MASKPIETGVVTVKIGANNEEYSFSPVRIQITAGTTITFTNLGNQIHNATPYLKPEWDTGDLATGESKAISFTRPGVYYYLCTPHPWMYGQIIVE